MNEQQSTFSLAPMCTLQHSALAAVLLLTHQCVCPMVQAQTVILINCGAQADLVRDLDLQRNSGTRIVVADSHRYAQLPTTLASAHWGQSSACTKLE